MDKILQAMKKCYRIGWRLALVGLLFVLLINVVMTRRYKDRMGEVWPEAHKVDCIMVLGAGVRGNERPTYMLADRLDKGIELYNQGVSNRLLMSGDHGRTDYDEVNVMKDYGVDRGIDADHIFMDHAGFSTYESMVRAKEVFQVESMVIVTQKYHLHRALYIANGLGIDAYGVPTEAVRYRGYGMRHVREALARAKDWVWLALKIPPKYLGEEIPITGSGTQTDDR